jgi:hypothetical protein
MDLYHHITLFLSRDSKGLPVETYLLKMRRIVHFELTGFFAMFIGLVVFVIISLDQPLSGPLAIDSGPYQLVLDRLIDLK